MKVKPTLRTRFLNFLKRYFNPLTLRLARSTFGPFAIVNHVGRRSGKRYQTPIIVQPVDSGFVFELTYGRDVDWYQNVRAAGRFTLHWHGQDYAIDKIEPLDTKTGRAAFPLPERLILRALNRRDFMKMLLK
jgi:deazaflavin-dependent oxidoreductase (nitroreductase family)